MSVQTEWAMKCPKCGSDESIDICAEHWVRLTEDGTDNDGSTCGDTHWDDDSRAACDCGFQGTVKDFEIEEDEARVICPVCREAVHSLRHDARGYAQGICQHCWERSI